MMLGELQVAFVLFLVGQSYESYEHWKDMVLLLCSCEDAVKTMPELFFNFIGMVYSMIE